MLYSFKSHCTNLVPLFPIYRKINAYNLTLCLLHLQLNQRDQRNCSLRDSQILDLVCFTRCFQYLNRLSQGRRSELWWSDYTRSSYRYRRTTLSILFSAAFETGVSTNHVTRHPWYNFLPTSAVTWLANIRSKICSSFVRFPHLPCVNPIYASQRTGGVVHSFPGINK